MFVKLSIAKALDAHCTGNRFDTYTAQAAIAAEKAALGIHLPLRAFSDEVGVMMMRGLSESVTEEARNQAKLIRNASQYLTAETAEATSGMCDDNRNTYDQNSNVTILILIPGVYFSGNFHRAQIQAIQCKGSFIGTAVIHL